MTHNRCMSEYLIIDYINFKGWCDGSKITNVFMEDKLKKWLSKDKTYNKLIKRACNIKAPKSPSR